MKEIIIIFLLITLTIGCIETEEVKEKEENIYPAFDITASPATDSSYNQYVTYDITKKEFSVPVISYNISRVIRDINNDVWYDPRLEFKVSINPSYIANVDDKGTIFFSVENLDERIETDYGDFRLITKQGGWYRATWGCDPDVWYERNSKTLEALAPYTLTLDLDVNQAGLSYLGYLNKISLPIVFNNKDNSWSETYNVTFVVMREIAL